MIRTLLANVPARRAAAVAALLAAVVQISPLAANAQTQSFTSAALTAPPKNGWPTNGGNLYNQRYSPLTAIDRSNVAQLKGVWRTRLNGSGSAPQYSGEAQPIVHDGIVYVSTGANDVFAISVDTGRSPPWNESLSSQVYPRRMVDATAPRGDRHTAR